MEHPKIAGFTFVKNAVLFDYPVKEAITSVLPLCDYFVAVVGNCNDGTYELIKEIPFPELKVYKTVWDETIRKGGRLLAIEANKALLSIPPKFQWIIYIQADEVIHENDIPVIKEKILQYNKDEKVEGLATKVISFYYSYDYYVASPSWNYTVVRIFKNIPGVKVIGDAITVGINNRKLKAKLIPAKIYHYGWVREPEKHKEKSKYFEKLWHPDDEIAQKKTIKESLPPQYLKKFNGTHPLLMYEKIKKWHPNTPPPFAPLKLKDKFKMLLSKITGKDFFTYKGYIPI